MTDQMGGNDAVLRETKFDEDELIPHAAGRLMIIEWVRFFSFTLSLPVHSLVHLLYTVFTTENTILGKYVRMDSSTGCPDNSTGYFEYCN